MKQIALFIFLGSLVSPVTSFLKTYVFSDLEFLKFLIVICGVDTTLGFVKAIMQKNVSSKGWGMIFKKIIIYSSALVTSHVLAAFTIHQHEYDVFAWFDNVIFSAIIVREALSVFENIAAIDPNAFPKWILKYLSEYDDVSGNKKIDGDILKDIKNTDK